MGTFLYFAYGSNLLKERLLARCPSAVCAGRATLQDSRLTFDKVSSDGSGKCTFEAAPGEVVEGVLWEMPSGELGDLDRREGAGRGYERDRVVVTLSDGDHRDAVTYCATDRKPDLQPYDWYLALVRAGARQQALSGETQELLAKVQAVPDPKPNRKSRREALDVLRKAGFEEVAHGLEAQG